MNHKLLKKINDYAILRHFNYDYCLKVYKSATKKEQALFRKEMNFALAHPEIKLGDPIIQLPN
jgi:hypothetical protein